MRALLAVPVLALAACGSPDPDDVTPDGVAAEAVREARESAGARLGDADLSADVPGKPVEVVTTRDGAIELGLTDQVLYSRLSERVRSEAAAEMEAETEGQSGLGGEIARAVTGAVAEGLETAVTVPVDRVRDVRVEGGQLVIEMESGEPSPFENAETDGEPMLAQFAPDDARRLAEAFDRIKGGR